MEEDVHLARKIKPNLTAAAASYTVTEGETIGINFVLDKAINDPCEYTLVILPDGTAEDGTDYTVPSCLTNDPDCGAIEENGGPVGYVFEVPAYSTNYTFNIETVKDILPEGAENFKVKVYSRRNLKGTASDFTIDLTINNFSSTDLIAKLDWSGTYLGTDGEQHTTCDYDLDLEIYEIGGGVVRDSYLNCPEQITTSTLPDGDYAIVASFWNLGTSDPAPNQDIPFKVTIAKEGIWLRDFELSGLLNSDMLSGEDGNPDAYIQIATVTKSGTTYTLKDNDGATLEQGKTNFIPSFRKK
jgi:hypothetical protein